MSTSTPQARTFLELLQRALPEIRWRLEFACWIENKLYSLDIACPEYKVDVELDGLQHRFNLQQVQWDRQRDFQLTKAGWSIVRVQNGEIKRPEAALELVRLQFPFEVRDATRRSTLTG